VWEAACKGKGGGGSSPGISIGLFAGRLEAKWCRRRRAKEWVLRFETGYRPVFVEWKKPRRFRSAVWCVLPAGCGAPTCRSRIWRRHGWPAVHIRISLVFHCQPAVSRRTARRERALERREIHICHKGFRSSHTSAARAPHIYQFAVCCALFRLHQRAVSPPCHW
jgi:hypothetical protein